MLKYKIPQIVTLTRFYVDPQVLAQRKYLVGKF